MTTSLITLAAAPPIDKPARYILKKKPIEDAKSGSGQHEGLITRWQSPRTTRWF
jgi:hypothetical protein